MSCYFGLDSEKDCRGTPCRSCTAWEESEEVMSIPAIGCKECGVEVPANWCGEFKHLSWCSHNQDKTLLLYTAADLEAAVQLELSRRIVHCENCGSDWVDNGINAKCQCLYLEAAREEGRRERTREIASKVNKAERLEIKRNYPEAFKEDV